jgi:hypothetical protein
MDDEAQNEDRRHETRPSRLITTIRRSLQGAFPKLSVVREFFLFAPPSSGSQIRWAAGAQLAKL